MPSTSALAVGFAPTSESLDAVLAALADAGTASGGAVDAATRSAALATYERLPAPSSPNGRAWRYSYATLPLSGLRWTTGRRSVPTAPLAALAAAADPQADAPALATESSGGLAHLGAVLLEGPGPTARDSRVAVCSLADARRDYAALLEPVMHRVAATGDRFAALATAFQNCGAFVYVPAGVQLDAPIQLLFSTDDGDGAAIFPHIVVVLGEGARATVIERYVGSADAFVCGIVEAHAAERAQLDLVAIQQTGEEARCFMTRAAATGRDAAVRWHLAELGGALVRSTVGTDLGEAGARGEVSALFFPGGMQHVDMAVTTEHRVGPTFSDTVARSAGTDRGQGRFLGNIVIRKHAHGADASLSDNTLLLSKQTHIDSIPALEIAANDVKAFHGATVGSVDDEQLFYARSRGIGRSDALRMIALGFFEPVISRFPGELLRDEIRTALDRKIDDATEVD